MPAPQAVAHDSTETHIGLRIGTVALSDHDPRWLRIFVREKRLLRRLLGDEIVGIEHVGSTAVPGLKAKPIIDVAIGTRALEIVARWAPVLQAEGYVYFGDQKARGDHFFARTVDQVETMYLHVVLYGSPAWKSYLDFRDRLRASSMLREEYERRKTALAADFPDTRGFYTIGKSSFFARLKRDQRAPQDSCLDYARRLSDLHTTVQVADATR